MQFLMHVLRFSSIVLTTDSDQNGTFVYYKPQTDATDKLPVFLGWITTVYEFHDSILHYCEPVR